MTQHRGLLTRIAEALREPAPAEPEPAPESVEPEPLPPGQRIVKVSFEEVLAERGYCYPHMRHRLVPLSDTERARRAAETALGRGEIVWPD